MLPHDSPWQTVYDYFAAWRDAGVWEAIHTALPRAVVSPRRPLQLLRVLLLLILSQFAP